MKISYVIFVGFIFVVLLSLAYLSTKNNWGSSWAPDPSTLVYSKDPRTGICYAQGSKILATVPCDKVQPYIK